MKKTAILNGFIEAGPLCTFLIYARLIDLSVSYNWLGPYLASSILAALITAFLLYQNIVLNRLFIGINAYFMSGCFGLIVHWDWLNHLYGVLQAAGMMIWIFLIGLLTLFFSPSGFLGIRVPNQHRSKQYSLYLLIATAIAFGICIYFRGNKILGEFFPFTSLFMAQRYLRKQLLTSSVADQ